MPFLSLFPSSPGGRPSAQPKDDAAERLIPFPARSNGELEPLAPVRLHREGRDPERSVAAPRRRARRRRQGTPWLQRNALSVAAVSVLVALLGLGFGLLQLITRPEPGPALLAIGQPEPNAMLASATSLGGAVTGGAQTSPSTSSSVSSPGVGANGPRREIQAVARVIEPNYTVEAGDTLARIALRFNTSVERIQALNNLLDPRALRIGTRLVVPPPL